MLHYAVFFLPVVYVINLVVESLSMIKNKMKDLFHVASKPPPAGFIKLSSGS